MNAPRTLVAISFFFGAIGCTDFEGLKLAKTDAGVSAQCKHASPRARSDAATLEVDNPVDIAFAVKTVDFGEGADNLPRWSAGTVGFDLDQTCTGEGEGPSCAEPANAGVAQLDGRDGIDNAAGTLARPTDGGGAASVTNAAAQNGGDTMLLYLTDYNRLPVDNDVQVVMYAVTAADKTPTWDGTFEWVPSVEWTLPGNDGGAPDSKPPEAKFKASEAYVSDGFLVAKFDRVVNLPAVRFSNVIIQAKIEMDPDTSVWELSNGIFAGRMNADDSLVFIEGRRDPNNPQVPVCRGSALYDGFKKQACDLADISFSGENDPSKPCDAISWAWKFEAVAARLSTQVDPRTFSGFDLCRHDVSPATDSCSFSGPI